MGKTCKLCKEDLDRSEFYRHEHTKDGLHVACKRCCVARARDNKLALRGKIGEEAWGKRIHGYRCKTKFGVSSEEYEKMRQEQGGVCKICGSKCDVRLAVDHRHSDGFVRGLLCRGCNTGLGNFKDSPDLLLKAVKYLG